MTPNTKTTTGTVLGGRYTLLAPIAQGGMGEVWKARDRVTGRLVAAKVLRSELSGEELSLSRLRLEARNAMSVQHPNIANVQDSGEEAGRGWIVMELVDGLPLTHYLRKGSRIAAEDLLPVLMQVAMALGAAASAGVVHRDIKPANVLIRADGIVKLTDFGISRASDQIDLTAAGMVMGTAQYLPPEQAMGEKATGLGDLYALGVIAYEALAGRRPFTGDTQVDIAFSHVNDPVPPLPPDVPAPFADVVLHLLEKNPAKRPESGRALVRELAAAAKTMGVPVEPHPLPEPSIDEDGAAPSAPGAPEGPPAPPAQPAPTPEAPAAASREHPAEEPPALDAQSWAASLPVADTRSGALPAWRRTGAIDAPPASAPAPGAPSALPRALPSDPRPVPGPDREAVPVEPAPPARRAPSPASQASGAPDRRDEPDLDVPDFLVEGAQRSPADSPAPIPRARASSPAPSERPSDLAAPGADSAAAARPTPPSTEEERVRRRAEIAARLKERAEARRSATGAPHAPSAPAAPSAPERRSLSGRAAELADAPKRASSLRAARDLPDAPRRSATPASDRAPGPARSRGRSARDRRSSGSPAGPWLTVSAANAGRSIEGPAAPTAYNRSRVAPPVPTGRKILRAALIVLIILAILAVGGYAIQHMFGSLTSILGEGRPVLEEVPAWPSPWAAA